MLSARPALTALPSALRPEPGPVPATQRSAKTNGTRLFVEGGDAQSPWSRRWRDLVQLYADDAGGMSTISALKLGLCETASTLKVEIEKLEAKLSESGDVDLDQLGRFAGHFGRVADRIGLSRAARDVTPSVADYVSQRAAEQRTEDTA